MPPKRKTTSTQPKSKKVAKTTTITVTSKRQTRSKPNEEPAILLEKTETVETEAVDQAIAETVESNAAPLSAIAARRAAINAGLYNPEPVDHSEEELDDDDDEHLQHAAEGADIQSVTDEEDEALGDELGEDRVMSPISGAATPNETSTPPRPLTATAMEPSKPKNKIPALMDYNSVSRFTPTQHNSCIINQEEDTYLFLGLKQGEHVVFMGQVLAAPLYGSMSIAGAVISSGRPVPRAAVKEDLLVSFYPAFSPRTHSLLSVSSESLDTASIQSHHSPVEIDEYLLEAVFDELKCADFESIIVIKDLEGSGLEDMCDAIPSFNKNLVRLTKKESSRDTSLSIHLLPGFHPILTPTPGAKSLRIESSWHTRTTMAIDKATQQATSPLVSVVCGAKDMGKSSYSRYLINRLLAKYNRVAYLETDVGQSEFTPSGLLSLHYISNPILGPPYTHQQLEPERSFYFGSTSPRSNPDYYLACIHELVDHWRHDQKQVRDEDQREWIPLVVNTQGWVSGVGYDLLISQIQKIEPTDVFAMRHHMLEYKNLHPSFNVDILPLPSTEAFVIAKEAPTLHYLDCVLQDPNVVTLADSFTSIQQRDITLGSYFHQSGMGVNHCLLPRWDYKKHMIHRVPWMVDWRQGLSAIWVIYEEVKQNELLYALNGSLVGLIGDVEDYRHQPGPNKKSAAFEDDTFTPPTYFNTQDKPAPNPQLMTCHGLAIVRSIDPSRHALLLLTPLPSSTLEKVSGLVKGEIQLPLWSMLDQKLEKGPGVANIPWKKVPYVTQQSTEGAGANALRVRRNLLRRSQA
ncbi:Inorganic pyrophosphatase [Mucor velutinosus]|uniref:Polynucleotide 5'-hydroxyl-kinase GRC3 n=1 Tax=Mucor velutinosus TaxID=708070 RepID=A0AAN7HXV9_9FUNG|nr:Inorganic pyrophosphatase [Mucor velutinosus]